MIRGFFSCRPPPRRRLLAVLLALLLGLFAASASRAEEEDDEVIHRAIEAGEIMPLYQLFGRIRREFGGRVLKVELEHESHGEQATWVYEAKVLTSRGQVLELEYNAKTLELIEVEGQHDDDD